MPLRSSQIKRPITFSAPPEFLGETGVWTPEHLFVAALVTCFVSTFSGMADLSKFSFVGLEVEAEGVLEKDASGWKFVEVKLRPMLKIGREQDRERANRLLQKAQKTCLVSRSLACATVLEPELEVEEEVLESEKMGNWIPIS